MALRAVSTEDFMTADWFVFPPQVLKKISSRITNEVCNLSFSDRERVADNQVKGVNRVVYDVTSKPPGT